MNKTSTNHPKHMALFNRHTLKLYPAPCIPHYCINNSTPSTAAEILEEYKKFKTDGGALIFHWVNRNSIILFRFSDRAYIDNFNNHISLETIGEAGQIYKYDGSHIYKIKAIPHSLESTIIDTTGETPRTRKLKSIFFREMEVWRCSKNHFDEHQKISRIMTLNSHHAAPNLLTRLLKITRKAIMLNK